MMPKGESLFFNRELSWLEFNQRVLDEALSPAVPLLERLNFLSITASNLDEFFMVRVGGLELLVKSNVRKQDQAGLTPAAQLRAISTRVHEMVSCQYEAFGNVLEPALQALGIRRVNPGELTPRQKRYVERHFAQAVFPVVTPMAVEASRGFPLLGNLALNVAVRLAPEPGKRRARYAVIPIGARMERFVSVPGPEGYCYMTIESILAMFADRFFPGEEVRECTTFRITRNADMSVREDMASDLMAEMENVLAWRKQSDCVRLEIESGVSSSLLAFLRRALKVREPNVYKAAGPLNLTDFRQLSALEGYDPHRYEPWSPQPSPDIDLRESVFAELSRRDVLLAHPYESFDPVVRLVEEAAEDPGVLAIKQILYRVSADSPIVAALGKAARKGKYVTVIVELKARFDEARNIEWARQLERDGVQVIYGIKGFKTHAKLCIVVRREADGIVRYLHFGTGNYHDKTARLYSDVGYMTRDADLGADASAFFNAISGYSEPRQLLKLEPAPSGMRDRLIELIENEAERRRDGQQALIMAKMNSLVDPGIIRALYAASKAGVTVKLNVRGICCLRPGVKKVSRNISVVSIVDRFLEHARIFYFHQGGEERVFISSADWMPRNLRRRIELMVPIDDPAARKKLIDQLHTYFADTVKARELLPDGGYRAVQPEKGRKAMRCQEALYRGACDEVGRARRSKRTVFEPHRAPGPK
jgi:polyphosphate kinase